jgi:hypothetical protein
MRRTVHNGRGFLLLLTPDTVELLRYQQELATQNAVRYSTAQRVNGISSRE